LLISSFFSFLLAVEIVAFESDLLDLFKFELREASVFDRLLSSALFEMFCFSRIYIFPPSINVDATWVPVIDYKKKL
jgi:hypothetical protein